MNAIQHPLVLTPAKSVPENELTSVTALKPGMIQRARDKSWLLGREYGERETEVVNFVLNRQVNSNKKDSNYHYSVLSLSQTWKAALKVAGITDRKAYQSRHTYAFWSLAAEANPNFIASQMGHANAQRVHNVYGS